MVPFVEARIHRVRNYLHVMSKYIVPVDKGRLVSVEKLLKPSTLLARSRLQLISASAIYHCESVLFLAVIIRALLHTIRHMVDRRIY